MSRHLLMSAMCWSMFLPGPRPYSSKTLEKFFLILLAIFMAMTSVTFFALYHQHHNIKAMKNKLDLVTTMSRKSLAFRYRNLNRNQEEKEPLIKEFSNHGVNAGRLGEPVPNIEPTTRKPGPAPKNMSFGQYLHLLQDVQVAYNKLKIPIKLSQTGLAVRMENPTSHRRGEKSTIRILSWTWRYPFQRAWFDKRKLAFNSCNLPSSVTCEYTTDSHLYAASDVILFRMRMLKNSTLPKYRFPHQKWLLLENEPPSRLRMDLNFPEKEKKLWKNSFNLTSTYMDDSNVPLKLQLKCLLNQDRYSAAGGVNFAEGKDKVRPAAIWTDVCESYSQRELYVKQLNQYVGVDVYGGCGLRACLMLESHNSTQKRDEFSCFLELLNTTYKFFLAFEDTLCSGFISGTLWSVYKAKINVLPVVLGVADYTRYLPKNTYLNVKDYKSAEELGEQMSVLNDNDELLNQKLGRVSSLDCESPKTESFKCRLCRYLHNHKRHENIVSDIFQTWNEEKYCIKPKEFYSQFLTTFPFVKY